jgi:serine/threonine protein kinase
MSDQPTELPQTRASASIAPALKPSHFGDYRLIRKIGEGGMGEVWEARQERPLTRTVAIKLIKAGMDSWEVVSRFEAERQALALMQHPHIAHVFEAGATDQGRPYFAMEFVEGVPNPPPSR